MLGTRLRGTGMSEKELLAGILEPDGPCLLCGSTSGRLDSHIFPAFVMRWMKQTSATGYMRVTVVPNLRIQDGPREHMLCADCEARLSKWETAFATKVFHPYMRGHRALARYSSELPLFVTSVIWRVLIWYRLRDTFGHKVLTDYSATDVAEACWRECLLGQRLNPGPHEIHFVRTDYVVGADYRAPPNLNSYLMRTFDADIMATSSEIFVYAKIPGFLMFGHINMKNKTGWRGTKLGFSGGVVGDTGVGLPGYVYRDIIEVKAAAHGKTFEQMSEKQQQRVIEAVKQDPERWARSGTRLAREYDKALRDGE